MINLPFYRKEEKSMHWIYLKIKKGIFYNFKICLRLFFVTDILNEFYTYFFTSYQGY